MEVGRDDKQLPVRFFLWPSYRWDECGCWRAHDHVCHGPSLVPRLHVYCIVYISWGVKPGNDTACTCTAACIDISRDSLANHLGCNWYTQVYDRLHLNGVLSCCLVRVWVRDRVYTC
jgi:hypothetical protein